MVKLVVPLVFLSAIASAEPTLDLGSPALVGGNEADRTVVGIAVAHQHDALVACYTTAYAKDPSLTDGVISVVLVITPNGVVSGAGVKGFNADVDGCMKTALKKLKLERMSAKLEVHYTFTITHAIQGGAFASLTGTGDISSGFEDANIYGGLLGNEVGSGGGGTGWGTIGTGRYGTIGHGSGGVGSGRGGMRGRSAAVPTVSLGAVSTSGKGVLDKAIVRRYIKRNIQKLQYCYEKKLLDHPKLAGTVTTAFTIRASGEVAPTAKVSGIAEVESCLIDVIQGIQFPKPKGDAEVDVTYPLTFRPSGS